MRRRDRFLFTFNRVFAKVRDKLEQMREEKKEDDDAQV